MNHDVIFVDWDGTLSGSKFWGHWAHDAKRDKAYAAIQEGFFKTSSGVLEDWMRGNLNAEDIMEQVARIAQLDPSELLAALQESCEAMQLFDNRLLDIVADLRARGAKVVIATDNMDTFTRWTIPALQLGSHFDAILNSHTLKVLKRDRDNNGQSKFFSDFLAEHNIEPSRAILVDDGLHNDVSDIGIRYIQVTPDRSALAILSNLSSHSRRGHNAYI